MQKISKEITINASKERVWHVLTDDAMYRRWSAAFSEGSYADTDWKEGSTVEFTDGSGTGMRGRIIKSVPGEIVRIEYDGEIGDSHHMTEDIKGAIEEYVLTETDGVTHLAISCDMVDEYVPMMSEMWDKALGTIKQLAEHA